MLTARHGRNNHINNAALSASATLRPAGRHPSLWTPVRRRARTPDDAPLVLSEACREPYSSNRWLSEGRETFSHRARGLAVVGADMTDA